MQVLLFTVCLILNSMMAVSPASGADDAPGGDAWISPKITANGDFEAPLDKKGRIPMWNKEELENLSPGRKEGIHRLEGKTADGHHVVLSATGDWYGLATLNYPVEPWTDRYEVTARLHCSGPAGGAQILVVWCDDYAQGLAKVDAGPVMSTSGWLEYSTGPLQAPPGAKTWRPVLEVRRTTPEGKAEVCFDDVDLRSLTPSSPKVEVWVNQVGYEQDGPKSAVVAANFLPKDTTSGRVSLVGTDEKVRHEAKITSFGRMEGQNHADWGWWFWRADFSEFKGEGIFMLKARFPEAEGVSYPFLVGKNVLFRETASSMVDFFFVQRCGFAVPDWHPVCHMDCAKLPDGTHRDLTGGWHSAGDYNKIAWEYGDGGVMYSLMDLEERDPAFLAQFDREKDGLPDVLDEARWGATYLAKTQIQESGDLLNTIQQGPARTWMKWSAPEVHTDNLVGTEDDPVVQEGKGSSPLAIGGWARLAKALEARGIASDYLDRAQKLWDSATNKGTESGAPLLLLSSLDLHKVTGDGRYLEHARRSAEAILKQTAPSGQLKGGYDDSGDIPAAALASFALALPEDSLTPRIREMLARHVGPFVSVVNNPFGVCRQKEGAGGFYFDPSSALGVNYMYACRAWSASLVYRLTKDPRALTYATDHLDFILGKNPFNLCMVEGKGSFNSPRYHHRYNKIPGRERGAVPGAIPNGFVRDMGSFDRPGFDLSTEGREYPSYRTCEPWLVHNVLFTLALAAGPITH